MGIDRTPLQIIEELLDGVVVMVEQEVPWKPGARELLAELRALAVPCALVTMSWRRFVEPVLRALPEGSFDAVVCGDEVDRGKPHPEPYLARGRACSAWTAGSTVAIEDSPTGRCLRRVGRLPGARRAQPRAGAAGGTTRAPRQPRGHHGPRPRAPVLRA